MKIALLMGIVVTFMVSMFTSGYDAKAGKPRKQ